MSKELGVGDGTSTNPSPDPPWAERRTILHLILFNHRTPRWTPPALAKCCRGQSLMSLIRLGVTVTHGGCHHAVKVHDGDGLTLLLPPVDTTPEFPFPKAGKSPQAERQRPQPLRDSQEGHQPLLDAALFRSALPRPSLMASQVSTSSNTSHQGKSSFSSMVSPGIWGVPYMHGTSTAIFEAKKVI